MSHESAAVKRHESIEKEAAHQPAVTVIINADDWGRDAVTTDRTLDCLVHEAISSVSAMVFMEDSVRAASLAQEHGVDAGLHLNFTTAFSAPQCPARLLEHQQKLARFLLSNRYAPVIYHPGLAASFEYVVRAQCEEYQRLYGVSAGRMDGHHHMHLCQNVFIQKLLPPGIIVRRNLTFAEGEAGYFNRKYRAWQDRQLAQRHHITDAFFDLKPLQPLQRFTRILELARSGAIEFETHPIHEDEYRFLLDKKILGCADQAGIACGYRLPPDHPNDSEGGVR